MRRGKSEEPRLRAAGRAAVPVPEPVLLRRADADPRARLGGDPQGHAARSCGPDRLRGDHRRRRGDPHRPAAARRDGGGDRLRRGRYLPAINGAAIAGAGRIIAIDRVASKLDLARTFGATDVIDAVKRDPVEPRSWRAHRRLARRPSRVRGDRPEKHRRAGLRRAAPWGYGDGDRHDPGRGQYRGVRRGPAVRAATARLVHGLDPLSGRHAAAGRLLYGR